VTLAFAYAGPDRSPRRRCHDTANSPRRGVTGGTGRWAHRVRPGIDLLAGGLQVWFWRQQLRKAHARPWVLLLYKSCPRNRAGTPSRDKRAAPRVSQPTPHLVLPACPAGPPRSPVGSIRCRFNAQTWERTRPPASPGPRGAEYHRSLPAPQKTHPILPGTGVVQSQTAPGPGMFAPSPRSYS